jgi:TonB-dependent receptor
VPTINKKMKYLFTLVLFAICLTSVAQNTGSIVGKLTDKDADNSPLPFASVIIKGTITGTTSDFDGLYAIDNLDAGEYIIQISFVGYKTVEFSAKVEAGKVTTINVPLGASAAALDEVIITTTVRRESEVALLLEQKKATTIIQSIGSDELARKGVSDAAGAVTKISGISKQEGGSNVYVRGLGDRYLNTTYNGLSLPSNDIDKKNIDLGLFSSDVIQSVGVSKAYSSKFYGDFSAGNINIVSKQYTGDGFLDVNLGSGMNTNSIGQNFVKSEGTSYFGFYNRYDNNPFAVILSHGIDPVSAGAPVALEGTISGGKSWDIGSNDRFSVFFTTSFNNYFEYRQGPAAEFSTESKKSFENAEEYEYSTTTTAMANFIYRFNSDHKISYNSLFINSASDVVGYFGLNGKGAFRDAILDTDRGFFQQNAQFDQDMIFVNQILGEHQIDEKIKIEYGVGYNKVFSRQPDRRRITLERYDLALDGDPNTNPFFFNNTNYDNQRYFQNIEDEELNSSLTIEYKVSEKLKVNVGYNGRTKERVFDNIRYGYTFENNTIEAPDVNNFDAIFSVANFGSLYNTEVFNAIAPENGVGNENRPGLPENTYTGNLNINAGFINAEIIVGDKLLVVPGIRFEGFKQEIQYDVINLLASDPGFRETQQEFFLPSLNLKYALSEDSNLRFAFSKTVSVPEFKEVAPFVYENISNQVGGNPDLLNDPSFSQIYNLDLKYESFYGRNEIFSIAAFAKQINNPINRVIANDATGTKRFFRTGDKAEVLGLEVEVRKTLLRNEDEKSILSAGVNATYTYTQQDLRSSEGLFSTTFDEGRTEDLQGASPIIVNADINYTPVVSENYEPQITAVFAYFSNRIDAIGSGQLGNIIEKGVPTLDLVWKNKIGEHFEINAAAKNLLNPTIEYYRETSIGNIPVTSPNGTGIASYTRGINLGIQVAYNF